MFGFLVILAVVIFGGLIALLGDRVGLKVGKKRLSIFGLRPKYTSMIITVVTGIFIAGLTLLVLTMMSEYVRTAIFELRNIQRELKVTTKRVNVLTRQVVQKEDEYKLLTSKYLELQKNLAKVIAQRQKAEQNLKAAQTQFKQAVKTLAEVETNLNSTKSELDLAQNRLNNLTKINNDLKDQISNLTVQEARLTQQIENLEGHMAKLVDENQTIISKPILFCVDEILVAKVVNPGIDTDQVFKATIEPLLKEANEIAVKRGARIPGKPDYALRVAPRRVAEVCVQLTEITTQAVLRVVVEKNSVTDEPLTVTLKIFPDKVIFKNGEVIVDTEVSGDTPETELRDRLLSLLILANNKAIDEGIITDKQNLRDLVTVYEIAKVINALKGNKDLKYRVYLKASGDIRRVDQLKVKFDYTVI